MRLQDLFGQAAAEIAIIVLSFHTSSTIALNFNQIPSPNLDLSALGRVALTGDFDAISLYTYEGQTENAFSTNGSQSLLSQMPNGAFANLVSADASINTMCPFVRNDGGLAGVILGGNFTSLGGVEAQGVALFNVSTGAVVPLTGLSGSVSALFCDKTTDTVYVGGDFKGANSTNAIAWVGMAGWSNLAFNGFNGPVNAITRGPNGNIIFGGSFSGLGNTTLPTNKDDQIINLSSAKISAEGSSTRAGFSDPRNIVCKTAGQDGPDNTWLLEDHAPGAWESRMSFGYEPTKLRLWNTHFEGRGTKTFRFTSFKLNGILNMSYVDSVTKTTNYCDARCPLSGDPNIPFQDFKFVNQVGMNGFRIDISDWYGPGAGLDGIELFENGMRLHPQLLYTIH
jgi:hypothetical protein